jgi:ketosteroid isomerase-like protein
MEPVVAQRLCRAVRAHDLDALVDCFTVGYRNETPAHPARGFVGREQVRRNWREIFAGVPDITADVLRTAVSGDELWSEWEMRGTRRDGSLHLMRGVVVFGVLGDRADWARFYLEPVDPGTGGVDEAVSTLVEGPGPTA